MNYETNAAESAYDSVTLTASGMKEENRWRMHVKELDEQFSRLDHQLARLTDRVAVALRSSEPATDPRRDVGVISSDSDVIAHLRHTAERVSRTADSVADLTERIDL